MKRDMDLIRALLLWIEADQPLDQFLAGQSLAPDLTQNVVTGHVLLLVEAGLIEAGRRRLGAGSFTVERITWHGHEFLDAIRNDSIWVKAKTLLKDKALAVPAEILTKLLEKLAIENLGIGL